MHSIKATHLLHRHNRHRATNSPTSHHVQPKQIYLSPSILYQSPILSSASTLPSKRLSPLFGLPERHISYFKHPIMPDTAEDERRRAAREAERRRRAAEAERQRKREEERRRKEEAEMKKWKNTNTIGDRKWGPC